MLKENKIFEDLLKSNKIDYDDIKSSSFIKTYDDDIEYDINMIVPINGRVNFLKPLYKSFINAISFSKLKICLTVVEMSKDDNQKEYCELNKINYLHINDDIFNKSLAMNFGALFSVNSKSFIFHDLDCLFDFNFFKDIEENIKNQKSSIFQCFADRRVCYLDDSLTNLIIDEKLNINDISIKTNGVLVDPTENPQAPGGSIYIDKDIFFEVGGYDPEFFIGYAPEDAFFWEKIELLGENIKSCDNPRIELYHMNHDRGVDSYSYEPMANLWRKFYYNDVECKLEILVEKKNILKEFHKGNITNKLETFIINEFFKIDNMNFSTHLKSLKRENLSVVVFKEDIKIDENIRIGKVNHQYIINCQCGQPIDKLRYNFCVKCEKLY